MFGCVRDPSDAKQPTHLDCKLLGASDSAGEVIARNGRRQLRDAVHFIITGDETSYKRAPFTRSVMLLNSRRKLYREARRLVANSTHFCRFQALTPFRVFALRFVL